MRKTLLIAAAALAGGIISSQAQVYSQNIVGYVNIPVLPGFNMIQNPLNVGVTNGINEVFGSSLNDGDIFFFFNGTGYTEVEYSPTFQTVFSLSSPWFNPINDAVVPIPSITPGEGFFYQNGGPSNTVTVAGTVIQQGTNGLAAGYNMVGSILPVGGSVTNTVWGLTPNDGDIYTTWDPIAAQFDQVEYSPTFQTVFSLSSPWFNPITTTVAAPPSYNVGQAFYYFNGSSTNIWVQAIP